MAISPDIQVMYDAEVEERHVDAGRILSNLNPSRINASLADIAVHLDLALDYQLPLYAAARIQDAACTLPALKALEAIDEIAKGHGVEEAHLGEEELHYVSMGSTYECTVVYWRGALLLSTWGDIAEGYEREASADADPRERALASHLGVPVYSISHEHSGPYGEGETYTCDEEPGEYAVLTDAEAGQAWDEALTSYLDECVLPEMAPLHRQYFDEATFKRDALLNDGRGHALAAYDGEEHEAKDPVTVETFYIYRTN